MPLNIALIGAGGMGMRHALGYAELRKHFDDVRMVAVCDPQIDSARAVAQTIASATPENPKVFASLQEATDSEGLGLEAVDIVTSTPAHHLMAIEAMESGLSVMVEKPMALTLAACRMMKSASDRTGRTLAIAENFRRDPMNRLAKALLDSDAIGTPYFALDISVGSANRGVMHSTVWRAKRDEAGGVVLDAGVHNADLLLYLMGPAKRVYAETDVNDSLRTLNPMSMQAPGLAEVYQHRTEAGGETEGDFIEQDAIDTAFASIRFVSGAAGQFIITDASHGYGRHESIVAGSEGVLYRPPSRSGVGPRIVLRDGAEVTGTQLLDLVPEFTLDEVTAVLWYGRNRLHSYEMDFRSIDSKIIAIEYMDFARAVREGTVPEVGPDEGMAALALAYSIMESGHSHNAVDPRDVVAGTVAEFQRDIDLVSGICAS